MVKGFFLLLFNTTQEKQGLRYKELNYPQYAGIKSFKLNLVLIKEQDYSKTKTSYSP